MNDRSILAMLRIIWDRWNIHEAQRLAAALAYYTILSLAPLVILVVAIAAMVFGPGIAQTDTADEVRRLMGGSAGGVVAGLMDSATHQARNLVAGVLATIFALVGASSVFLELRSSLNVIWGVQEQSTTWYGGFIKDRLFAFGMMLALGIILLLSVGFSLTIAVVERFSRDWLPFSAHAMRILNDAGSFVLICVVFSLIFRFVPEKRIRLSDAVVGAVATAILFEMARLLLDLYLLHASVGSAYGAAGSVVVFLFWVYCSAQLFYLGSEFTRAYAEHFGGGISPDTAISNVPSHGPSQMAHS